MKAVYRLSALFLACALAPTLACGPVDGAQELQALAGEASPEAPAAATAPAGGGGAPQADPLDSFPLGGSVFPGMGGRLHTALCDPTSDAYSTCI